MREKEEILSEFLETPVNAIGLPLGDMILHNGEILREMGVFIEALEKSFDEYADWKIRELYKQRILKRFGSEKAKREYFTQKQRECRARKLSNKDKK